MGVAGSVFLCFTSLLQCYDNFVVVERMVECHTNVCSETTIRLGWRAPRYTFFAGGCTILALRCVCWYVGGGMNVRAALFSLRLQRSSRERETQRLLYRHSLAIIIKKMTSGVLTESNIISRSTFD